MESLVVRYRNLLVLLALLVAQILGLAMQVHRSAGGQVGKDRGDGSSVRLIRYWANALVSPPEKALHSSGSGVSWLWNNYIDLRHVRTAERRSAKDGRSACGWSRPRCWKTPSKGSGCRLC